MQFVPWISFVDVSFWTDLAKKKLEEYKLNGERRKLAGFYAVGSSGQGIREVAGRLCVKGSSLDADVATFEPPAFNIITPGSLLNFNTIEEFKEADKNDLQDTAAQEIWNDVLSGRAEANTSLLNRFLLLTHADLKNWRFYYWFCFPAVLHLSAMTSDPPAPMSSILTTADQRAALQQAVSDLGRPPFFLAMASKCGGFVEVASISDWNAFNQKHGNNVLLGFMDPSSHAQFPGWPLRNFLLLAAVRWRLTRCHVLCYRERIGPGGLPDMSPSIVLPVSVTAPDISLSAREELKVKGLGWERNARGSAAPRVMDLGATLDPRQLADKAVDLNVKLMRWRIAPTLDPQHIAATKCLLLGAGTLGCAVARALLGWGVRHISFVDSGRVSFSNPVRQSLFDFDDCLEGGKPKAATAAKNLQRIFPLVKCSAYDLSIPMPGHPVSATESSAVEQCVRQLEQLIIEHDVVFLLTDTRESRWLPTMLCAANNKLAITVALGFESFVVMRHGVRLPQGQGPHPHQPRPHLGCYFCQDIVAPVNSMKDRTLDQQCTVTRPGLAFISSALAVELLVTLIHHPLGFAAPADVPVPVPPSPSLAGSSSEPSLASPLGLVPHSIRGSLSQWTNTLLASHAFPQCTACSQLVCSEYESRKFEMLMDAFGKPHYLEELTGLSAMMAAAADAEVIAWDDDD